jgi:hypothetical protein
MKILALLLIIIALPAYAAVLRVGPSEKYMVPSEAASNVSNGDTVEITAGDYIGDGAIWTKNDLLIRGVGGRVHLIGGLKLPQDKAIWIVQGQNTTIENIEFSDARVPDKNGAGIRMEGTHLTVRHCYFHDNEDGILAGDNANSDILIEFCEFSYMGFGDGFSHNLYINHVRSLTFRFNYSHHAKSGHTLKTRAHNNYIMYNFLTDSSDGNSSYLLDMPNGGKSFVIGNIFYESQASDNYTSVTFGTEGFNNPEAKLYFVNNTLVSGRTKCGFVNVRDGATDVRFVNNIFCGTTATAYQPTIAKWTLQNNIFTEKPDLLKFQDVSKFNYHITVGSSAIGAGIKPPVVDCFDTAPKAEYVHPHDSVNYISQGIYDIGAYHFPVPSDVRESATEQVIENINGIITLPENTREYTIFDIMGNIISNSRENRIINTSALADGLYFIQIKTRHQIKIYKLVVIN